MQTEIKPSQTAQELREEKIKAYLNTLEDHFASQKNSNLLQERVHRVNKALNSIKEHTDCAVTPFSTDDKPIIINEKKEEEIAQLSRDKEVDELLQFLEKHLNLDENCTPNSMTPVKENNDQKRLSKMFLEIELKLKSYLEQQKIMRSSEKKPRLSLRQKRNSVLPRLLKNYFDDQEKVKMQIKNELERRKSEKTKDGLRFSIKKKNDGSERKKFCYSEKQEPSIRRVTRDSIFLSDFSNIIGVTDQIQENAEDEEKRSMEESSSESEESEGEEVEVKPIQKDYISQFKRSSIIKNKKIYEEHKKEDEK